MYKLIVLIICSVSMAVSAQMMVGGFKDLDVENDAVRTRLMNLTAFAAEKIAASDSKNLNSNLPPLKYDVIRIVSAKSQVVAGIKYAIQMRMKVASCKRNCKIMICDVVIYERTWENYRELSSSDCKVKETNLLGGKKEISTTDESARQALQFAITMINRESNNLYQQNLVTFDKATSQIVSGIKYEFEFTIGQTDCMKNQKDVQLELCAIKDNSKNQKCKVTIWDQPWRSGSRYQIVNTSDKKCQ